MENQSVSLYQLLGQVKQSLKIGLPSAFWVVAEISELKVNYNGHCYLELIEKESTGESIKAKARATIWASAYRMIRPYFETSTHTTLAAGIKVLIKVTAEFHELYGFSLNITDIEPSYTVGEMARQKQEIINRLVSEGVFDMNKSLPLPDLPRRIAVISSRTAAGLGDFMDQLTRNAFGYRFYVKLFPAVMQGEEAEQSIIAALDKVFKYEWFFDVVVIIRGGGAQSELNCFNGYWLAYHICQFPLPILTGIGHEQDETIADLVANTRLKTPTAVAEFLIGSFRQADENINELSVTLTDVATALVEKHKQRLSRFMLILRPAVRKCLAEVAGNLNLLSIRVNGSVRRMILRESGVITRRGDRLNRLSKEFMILASHRVTMKSQRIREIILKFLEHKTHSLEMLERKSIYLDPFLILKRGYSVTYYNGKALKDPETVPENGDLSTRLAGGILKSKRTQSKYNE
jgi:exodeoxyribonuclease VII large subunit